MECSTCFFSQLVDGVLFCNHYGEEMCLEYTKYLDGDYECLDYANSDSVKNILNYYNNFLKENFTEISNLEEVYDDFLTENKDLL